MHIMFVVRFAAMRMESVHLGRDDYLVALKIICVQHWVFPLDFLDSSD